MEGAPTVAPPRRAGSNGGVVMRYAIGVRPLHRANTLRTLNGRDRPSHPLTVSAPIRIALIAHDGQKQDMIEWAVWNRALLTDADLCGTRHTAKLVSGAIGAPVRALVANREDHRPDHVAASHEGLGDDASDPGVEDDLAEFRVQVRLSERRLADVRYEDGLAADDG